MVWPPNSPLVEQRKPLSQVPKSGITARPLDQCGHSPSQKSWCARYCGWLGTLGSFLSELTPPAELDATLHAMVGALAPGGLERPWRAHGYEQLWVAGVPSKRWAWGRQTEVAHQFRFVVMCGLNSAAALWRWRATAKAQGGHRVVLGSCKDEIDGEECKKSFVESLKRGVTFSDHGIWRFACGALRYWALALRVPAARLGARGFSLPVRDIADACWPGSEIRPLVLAAAPKSHAPGWSFERSITWR